MSFDRVWSRVTQWSVSSRQKGGQASAQPQFQQQPMQKCVVAKQKKTKNTTHYPFLEVSVIYYIKKRQWHCSSGSLCCYKIIQSWSISECSFCFCSVQLRRYAHKHGDNAELTLAFTANTAPLGAAFIAAVSNGVPQERERTEKSGEFYLCDWKRLDGDEGASCFLHCKPSANPIRPPLSSQRGCTLKKERYIIHDSL